MAFEGSLIINYFLQTKYILAIHVLILSTFSSVEMIVRIKKKNAMSYLGQLKTTPELYCLMHNLLRNLGQIEDVHYFGFYCGIISVHALNCENSACPSHELYEYFMGSEINDTQSQRREEVPQLLNNYQKILLYIGIFSHPKDIPENLISRWRSKIPLIGRAIGGILEELKVQQQDSIPLYMLKLYYDCEYSGYVIGAIEAMEEIEKMKPGTNIELEIYIMRQKIERNFRKANTQASIHCSNYVDHLETLNFHNIYTKFIDHIERAIRASIEFWGLFIKQEISISDLIIIGEKIVQYYGDITFLFEKLRDIQPRNRSVMYKYGLYLQKILCFEQEGREVLRRLLDMLKIDTMSRISHYSIEKFGKVMLIRSSACRHNLGEILDANYEVESFIEYQRSEIIGHYNTLLQPPMVAREQVR